MIARVNTPARRARFRNACRGRWVLDALLPLDQQIFGKSQPGRFYAGPTLALELSGRTAWAAGHANPEELASFLAFCGCGSVILDEGICPPPTGWTRARTQTIFGLAAGEQLPLPAQTEKQRALWDSLTRDEDPASGPVAEVLFPDADLVEVRDLQEMCFGSFEGRNFIEMEHDPDYLAWVNANCESPCPDGETKAVFSERVCKAFSALVDRALADGEETLVILAHGGTQMAAMERYALPHADYYHWCAPNAGGYLLDARDWAEQRVLHLVRTVQYTKEAAE